MADDVPGSFDEVVLRWERFFERTATQPVVEVVGVVAPGGPGGGGLTGDGWLLMFQMSAWRIKGGPLQSHELKVCRKVTHDQLREFMGTILPYAVLRIHARVMQESSECAEAQLESVMGTETGDAEMNAFAAELQKPVTFEDAEFGTFTLDRGLNRFSAEVLWDGSPISLHLHLFPPGPTQTALQDALRIARALWQDQRSWNERIRKYAVEQLLDAKTDNWLEADEAALTAEQFNDRMTLDSITVDAGGTFECWFDDGDLFWGHAIDIRGTLTSGFIDGGISG